MTILKMFEHVSIMAPIEQRLFINYYNETVDELCGLYDKYVLKNETADPESVHIQSITDEEGGILPLYHTAMIDNIYQYIIIAKKIHSIKCECIFRFIYKILFCSHNF